MTSPAIAERSSPRGPARPSLARDEAVDLALLVLDAAAALDIRSPAAQALVERAEGMLRPIAPTTPGNEVGGRLSAWRARRAAAFIDENSDRNIQVRDVAAVVRLSPSYFSHAFKESFGRSAKAYIIERRLLRAKRMMLTSAETLAQIALACGFADQSHFCRVFTAAAGVSPRRWRDLRRTADLADPARAVA